MEHVVDDCTCEGTKCSGCQEVKCCGAFGVVKKTKSGRASRCKKCSNEKRRMQYIQDRKQNLAQQKAYREAHQDKCRAQCKAYYQSHKEQRSAYNARIDRKKECERVKQYYQLHVQETIDRVKVWQENNKDHFSAQSKKYKNMRRAHIRQCEEHFTAQQWVGLIDLYSHTCLCCGRQEPEIKLHADHIVPLSEGGSNSIDNIQPLCQSCNSRKGRKTIDYRKLVP